MSYLNNVRLVFSGKFQADVSTVNNAVHHFNNDTFKPKYQEYGPGATNGWWNPCGSGAFRLIDCKVEEVGYADGTLTSDSSVDPVVGMLIGGSNQQVSGKMVDLDPQMQMVTEIWGLEMRLTNGETDGFFSGKFKPAAFRDIFSGRQQQSSGGDANASTIFQSTLEDLSWVNTDHSPFLQELKQLSAQVGKLSVRMMVYSYNMDKTSAEFTLGNVSGVIGPALENEPDTFILGRRFAPANSSQTAQNINFFNAQLNLNQTQTTGDPTGNLIVDFSNALPLLNGQREFVNIGHLQLVALTEALDEGTTHLSESLYVPLGGAIPYLSQGWLEESGALFNVDNLTGQPLATVMQRPLALLNMDNKEILIRETQNGLLVRTDQVVHRLNPTTATPASVTVDFYASQYGFPSQQTIDITLQKKSFGTSRNGDGVTINHPASALQADTSVTTNADGKGEFSYKITPPGNPRKYVDGQVYLMNYTPTNAPDYIQQYLDIIANLAHDEFTVPDTPTWADIKTFMTQYGNLYPVMSKMLVDLSNYESVIQYRSLLELAFSRPIHDPNYMPVTRDLSNGKRQTVLKWLTAKDAEGNYTLLRGDDDNGDTSSTIIEPCPSCEIDSQPPTASNAAADAQEELIGSKQLAEQNYKRNLQQ